MCGISLPAKPEYSISVLNLHHDIENRTASFKALRSIKPVTKERARLLFDVVCDWTTIALGFRAGMCTTETQMHLSINGMPVNTLLVDLPYGERTVISVSVVLKSSMCQVTCTRTPPEISAERSSMHRNKCFVLLRNLETEAVDLVLQNCTTGQTWLQTIHVNGTLMRWHIDRNFLRFGHEYTAYLKDDEETSLGTQFSIAAKEWIDAPDHVVLGIPDDATEREIMTAFRSLAIVWHPDKNKADEECQRKANKNFQRLKKARDRMLKRLHTQAKELITKQVAGQWLEILWPYWVPPPQATPVSQAQHSGESMPAQTATCYQVDPQSYRFMRRFTVPIVHTETGVPVPQQVVEPPGLDPSQWGTVKVHYIGKHPQLILQHDGTTSDYATAKICGAQIGDRFRIINYRSKALVAEGYVNGSDLRVPIIPGTHTYFLELIVQENITVDRSMDGSEDCL